MEAAAETRQRLNATVTTAVVDRVRAFDGWYDHAAITTFAKALAGLTGSGQRQTASATSSYLARLLRLLTGRTGTVPGRIPVTDLRGVPLDSVFGRLADEYRWLRSDGVSVGGVQAPGLDEARAVDRVVTLAETMVDQSMSLAMVEQWAHATERAPKTVDRYRRVLHPELPTEASLRDGKPPPPVCGLCAAASTMVFKRGDLMPMHASCRCLPMVIVGEPGGPGDIGALVNEADLARLYRDAGGSTAAAALKRTKYTVQEHTELGPQLVLHGAPRPKWAPRPRTVAQRAAARESAARSRAAARGA